MKSTKKIFVVAIAALMLFAFTACNNTMPSAFKSVEYVEVQQIESYLKGETAKESGFQVVVNYTEGEPTVLKGSIGTIKLVDETGKADGTVLAAVADGLKFYDKKDVEVPAVPAEIAYEDVTSATISGVETYTVEEGWTPSAFDTALEEAIPEELADATITLAGGDVSKTFSLADKKAGKFDYVLSLYKEGSDTPLGTDIAVTKGDTYNVYLAKYKLVSTEDFTVLEGKGLDTGLVVSVGPKTTTEVTGIEVRYSVNSGKAVTKLPTLYAGDTVEVQVFELYNNDKEAAETSAEISFVNMTAGEAPESGASFDVETASDTVKTTAAGTVRVTIEGEDEEETIYQAPFSIGTGENWYTVTGLTAAYADEATAVKPGHVFGANNVTPAVTWGDTDAEGKTSITYTFEEASVPSDYKGTTFSTLCTARWTEKGDVKTLTVALDYTVGTGE